MKIQLKILYLQNEKGKQRNYSISAVLADILSLDLSKSVSLAYSMKLSDIVLIEMCIRDRSAIPQSTKIDP